MEFDIGRFDILAPEVTRINDGEQVIENLNDGRLVRERRRGQVLQLRLQFAKRLQNVARDFTNLVAFFEMLVHAFVVEPPRPG